MVPLLYVLVAVISSCGAAAEYLQNIEDVAKISASPNRLPPNIANKIYDKGESGMGYYLFRLCFRNGQSQCYVTGNAIDFALPPVASNGFTASDIVDVHGGNCRNATDIKDGSEYVWCIYDGVADGA